MMKVILAYKIEHISVLSHSKNYEKMVYFIVYYCSDIPKNRVWYSNFQLSDYR